MCPRALASPAAGDNTTEDAVLGMPRRTALLLAILTVGCGNDNSPTGPTATTPGTPTAALMSCPPSVERQSVDALPVTISWDLPTVDETPVGKSSCSPASPAAFSIGTSTVTCTPDQPTLASSCSFSVTITQPDRKLRLTQFLAFGDSITLGFLRTFLPPGVTAGEFFALLRSGGRWNPGITTAVDLLTAYPAQLQNLLTPVYPTQSISVTNAGQGGESTVDGVSRLTSSLLLVQPEVLLLFEGFNDLFLAMFIKEATGDDKPVNVAPIAANLRSMAANARDRGVEVLLATLTPVSDEFENNVFPGMRAAIMALNADIRGIAAEFGLGDVVDLHDPLAGVPGLLGPDGFHPSVAGYRRMAEIFFDAIVSRYDITPQPPTLTTVP